MASTSKLYVPLSVVARFDRRLMRAGPEAELLFYRLLQLAKQDEHDGVLHAQQIIREAPWPKTADKAFAALVREGALRDVGADEYAIPGWLDWNDSKDEMEDKRRKERDRKKGWREGQRGVSRRDTHGTDDGTRTGQTTGVPPHELRDSATERSRERSEAKRSPDEVDLVLQPTGVGSAAGSGTVNGFTQAMHKLGGRA